MVGEHKQLYFTLDVFLKAAGEEGVEDGNGGDFIDSRHICGTFNFFFLVCAMSTGC